MTMSLFFVALGLALELGWLTERQGSPSGELHKAEAEEVSVLPRSVPRTVVALVLGLALLIGGSQALLKGAVGLAG